MMNKFQKFAYVGAIALLSTGFVACTSEDDVADVNPTYDGESVKTAFALNIPHAAQTRMTTTITQQNATFRGMQDIFLIPFKSVPSASTVFPFKNINLAALTNTEITTGQSSKIYQDVNIGVGTTDFLFYGEATHGTFSAKGDKFANGILTKTLTTSTMNTFTTPSQITFDLNPVYDSSSEGTDFANTKAALLTILNGVANVTFGTSDKAWKTVTTGADGLEFQALVDTYQEFTKTGRSGSGPNVKNTMQALYNNVHWIKETAVSTDVQALCDAIMTQIAVSFDVSHSDASHTAANPSSPDFKPECNTLTWKTGTTDMVKEFPNNTFGLPYGAAELKVTDNTAATPFAYNDTPVGTGFGGGNNLNVADLCFPASLQYFCNTPAKANNKNVETWPVTPSAWDTYDSNWDAANGWGNTVTATTRSIALRNNINYGVAQLKATVKCKDAATLEDNSEAKDGPEGTAENIHVTIPTEGFTITGFLIGGQPQQVDWQFLPSTGTARSRIIYDNTMNETMAAKQNAAVGANYTLVLDNYTSEATQEKVNIAVELVNNSGTDFWGYNGLIRAGEKFYLIGQLDLGTKTIDDLDNKPYMGGTYRYPQSGTLRIFMQDYTTEANFLISDLKKAYSTIPDLRVAKLELGLSVDLQWTSGLTFNDVPLGN